MIASDALLPDNLAILRVVAMRDPAVGDRIDVRVDVQQRGLRGRSFALFPGNVRVCDVTFAAELDRAKSRFLEARRGENQSVGSHGTGRDAFALAVNSPDQFARPGIKSLDRVSCGADQLSGTAVLHQDGRHVRDARLAAFPCPRALAGLRVQSDDDRAVPRNLPAQPLL